MCVSEVFLCQSSQYSKQNISYANNATCEMKIMCECVWGRNSILLSDIDVICHKWNRNTITAIQSSCVWLVWVVIVVLQEKWKKIRQVILSWKKVFGPTLNWSTWIVQLVKAGHATLPISNSKRTVNKSGRHTEIKKTDKVISVRGSYYCAYSWKKERRSNSNRIDRHWFIHCN